MRLFFIILLSILLEYFLSLLDWFLPLTILVIIFSSLTNIKIGRPFMATILLATFIYDILMGELLGVITISIFFTLLLVFMGDRFLKISNTIALGVYSIIFLVMYKLIFYGIGNLFAYLGGDYYKRTFILDISNMLSLVSNAIFVLLIFLGVRRLFFFKNRVRRNGKYASF